MFLGCGCACDVGRFFLVLLYAAIKFWRKFTVKFFMELAVISEVSVEPSCFVTRSDMRQEIFSPPVIMAENASTASRRYIRWFVVLEFIPLREISTEFTHGYRKPG